VVVSPEMLVAFYRPTPYHITEHRIPDTRLENLKSLKVRAGV
jgi:hypothetical protein